MKAKVEFVCDFYSADDETEAWFVINSILDGAFGIDFVRNLNTTEIKTEG